MRSLRWLLVATIVLGAPIAWAAGFRVGIAVRNVTPEPLLPVSGGVGPSHATTKKQGELTVRALVFESGSNRVALVVGDFLGFPAVLGDRVRAAVPGVPPENIVIGATHTHSAPDCYGFPDGRGGTGADFKYLERVCVQAAEAITEAVTRLQPAGLRIATGEARGQIAYNYYAEKLYDARCHVVQAVDAAGKSVATLVNYAIHPEVIGSERGICSPDLVGPLCDRIAEGGGGTGIFLNSALGGMVTADNRRPGGGEANDWAECQRIGRLLADEALRIVQNAPVQAEPTLFCAARRLTLPVDSPLMRQLLSAIPGARDMAGTGDQVVTRLNLINVGNAQLLTIPGEALPNIGCYLKRKMRGEHNLLFGLANDALGYIMAKEDYDSFKRYEYISRTSLGERTGVIFVEEALKLVGESPAPQVLAD
ncbi:MAG TPA: hypothetical protein PKM73_15645 [Verrucomicrobiota bacterium]|nr:hypothetical protein [Verrucomicrobiota bacterium]HNU52286.1 hypothetical protein [Verrucomicrobiota bacterium]